MSAKFKVGDKVKLRTDDRNRYTDFMADLQMNVADRTISGRAFDALTDAIDTGKPFRVALVDDDPRGTCYELRLGKIDLSFMPEEDDLIAA